MDTRINAHCKICGKGYHMCLSCRDYANLHPWQAHTDTGEHYKIFQILRGITNGVLTDAEAKERLETVNLEGWQNFLPEVRDELDRIMKFENTKAKTTRKKRAAKPAEDISVKE